MSNIEEQRYDVQFTIAWGGHAPVTATERLEIEIDHENEVRRVRAGMYHAGLVWAETLYVALAPDRVRPFGKRSGDGDQHHTC